MNIIERKRDLFRLSLTSVGYTNLSVTTFYALPSPLCGIAFALLHTIKCFVYCKLLSSEEVYDGLLKLAKQVAATWPLCRLVSPGFVVFIIVQVLKVTLKVLDGHVSVVGMVTRVISMHPGTAVPHW
jgi:hypothetical protein